MPVVPGGMPDRRHPETVGSQGAFSDPHDVEVLVAKLDDAEAKLLDSKNADAEAKVTDYQAKLAALANATKPKVDSAVAATLSDEAQGVIDCIDAIGTSTTP